jgi:magnesium-dependent phosphatase 1
MYSGTKKRHFEKLKARTGIPYADMLFFDNEEQNTRDVATLGVTCVLCVGGMTERAWEDGLRAFVEKKALVARRRAAAAAKR